MITTLEELEQTLTKADELELKINKLMQLQKNFEEEISKCQQELAELKENKKEGKWKPKEGEEYWYRNPNKTMYVREWANDEVDNALYNNTPIFPTQLKCEKYWHFMDIVKEKSYEFSKEELVDTNIEKWYIGLKHGGLCVDFVYGVGLFGTTYFKTEDDAQYIIDNFKDELMEFWI